MSPDHETIDLSEQSYLLAAKEEYLRAKAVWDSYSQHLIKKYGIKPGEFIQPETGVITRVAAPPGVSAESSPG